VKASVFLLSKNLFLVDRWWIRIIKPFDNKKGLYKKPYDISEKKNAEERN